MKIGKNMGAWEQSELSLDLEVELGVTNHEIWSV